MEFQVKRKIIRTEYGTLEADSHQQAVDMLKAGLWGDSVHAGYAGHDRENINYEVNGVEVG